MSLTPNRSTSLTSSLLLIAPFFLWGTAMVAMKGVIPQTTPFFMAGIRLGPAGILVLLVAWLWKRPQPQGVKAWLWIIIFALLDGAMFQGFLAAGLFWSLYIKDIHVSIFFLACVCIAALYGSYSTKGIRILIVQGVPAFIALAVVLINLL